MSASRHYITAENPNDQIGGGGCVCGEGKQTGCTGPYAVFPTVETDSGTSPFVVISAACLESAIAAAKGDILKPTQDKL